MGTSFLMLVRKLQSNDYGPYCSLIVELYSDSFTIDSFYEYLFNIEKNNNYDIFILEDGNNIVASIKIFIEPTIINNLQSKCYITELLISKKNFNDGFVVRD